MAQPSATLDHLQKRAEQMGAAPLFYETMLPALYPVCIAYGIDPTAATGQSYHETGGARFGRAVTPEHRNYCGLKVRDPGGLPDNHPDAHATFATWTEGAEAFCSHLRAYCNAPIEPPLVDKSPRSVWVWGKQDIDRLEELGGPGSWAPSPTYGQRVADTARRFLEGT